MQRLSSVAGVFLCVSIASVAQGGPLAIDPAALPGWHGTMNFTDGVVNANVDYAVYAPGQYVGTDPSLGTRYVYAYQGFDISPTRPFDTISVGLQDRTVVFDGGYDPVHPQVGGVIPFFQDSRTTTNFPTSAFRSIFQNPQVPPGGFTQVLLITSPDPPQFFSSSVLSVGNNVNGMLPSPIPEPASIIVFAIGGVMSLRRRRS